MGKKTDRKIKNTAPIPFPHDGPIYQIWCQRTNLISENNQQEDPSADVLENNTREDDEDDEAHALLDIATALNDSSSPMAVDSTTVPMITATRNSFLIISSLIQSLRQAKTSISQIQLLQSFRSSEQKNLMVLEEANDAQSTQYVTSLFRLLLEWSFSERTPLPLQRTLCSVVQHMATMMDRAEKNDSTTTTDKTLYTTVVQSVLRSILHKVRQSLSNNTSTSNGLSCSWNEPLHTLEVALLNPMVLRTVLQTTEYLSETIEWLYQTVILPSPAAQQQTNSGTSIIMFEEQETAVVTNLLKSLIRLPPKRDDPSKEQQAPPPRLDELYHYVLVCLTRGSSTVDGGQDTGSNTNRINLGILYGRLMFWKQNREPDFQWIVEWIKSLDVIEEGREWGDSVKVSMIQGMAAALQQQQSPAIEVDAVTAACWQYCLAKSDTATDAVVRYQALQALSTIIGSCCCGSSTARVNPPPQRESSLTDDRPNNKRHELVQETLTLVLRTWENPPLRKIGTMVPSLFQKLVSLLTEAQIQQLCQNVLAQPLHRKGRYLALDVLLPFVPDQMALEPDTLVDAMGDSSPNNKAIADLWKQILLRSWATTDSAFTRSPRKQIHVDSTNELADDGEDSYQRWIQTWIPSFSSALVVDQLVRRKKVAAFGFPRIVDAMKSVQALKRRIPAAFGALLHYVRSLLADTTDGTSSGCVAKRLDPILWAQLEIVRMARIHKVATGRLKIEAILSFPLNSIPRLFVHADASVRTASFLTLEALVHCHDETVEKESCIWKEVLPTSMTLVEGNENMTSMLQCLLGFLDRLTEWQAATTESPGERASLVYSFCIDFMVNTVILRNGLYPGTVASKESFCMSLLECLLAFVAQDSSVFHDTVVARNGEIFSRKRSSAVDGFLKHVLEGLVCDDLVSALFSTMYSVWDATRLKVFRFLVNVFVAAQERDIGIPGVIATQHTRDSLERRALFLTSSPRSREADPGARLLATIYFSQTNLQERQRFLQRMANIQQNRIQSMRQHLTALLNVDTSTKNGAELPLAHGIIQAVRLMVEELDRFGKGTNDIADELGIQIIADLTDGLRLSLAVVADVQMSESLVDNEDGQTEVSEPFGLQKCAPINVNTGAIGANGSVSSLSNKFDEASRRRNVALQRIVVGSWLLTKETCAALASVIAAPVFNVSATTIDVVGNLLIRTLTTIKHAGAAFAARDSLQLIAMHCLTDKREMFNTLPRTWANTLLDEISHCAKVRDSTLRRSTGYALGFVALLRTMRKHPNFRSVSGDIIEVLVRLSLPPKQVAADALEDLDKQDASDIMGLLPLRKTAPDNSGYEPKTRVHALNILRMIIMDAPLADTIRPSVGKCMVSSLVGYTDADWAIRNSSTMVFSAAMLRVIDADKNASNSDKTSSTAISLTELFKRYPDLQIVMKAVLRGSSLGEGGQPRLFPVLLLLSRIQPVVESAGTYGDSLVSLVRKSLDNRELSIRAVTARALGNVCCEREAARYLESSIQLIERCTQARNDWNKLDGKLRALHCLLKALRLRITESTRSMILEKMERMIGSCQHHVSFPPDVLATSIEVVSVLWQECDSFEAKERWIVVLQNVVKNWSFGQHIGGAKVYVEGGKLLYQALSRRLWKPTEMKEFESALERLGLLLDSDILDLRSAVTKALKKDAYYAVKDLGQTQKISSVAGASVLLNKMTARLLKSITVEMDRDNETRGDHNGERLHPPTLRRMTRVYLECVESMNDDQLQTLFDKATAQCVLQSAASIIRVEHVASTQSENHDGCAYMSGNAIEMMASVFSVFDFATCCSSIDDEFVTMFVETVQHLNHPYISWRSRHSAAMAIKTSRILARQGVEWRKHRTQLLHVALHMLQDVDPDVRNVAVDAVNEFGTEQTELSWSSAARLPGATLARVFPAAFSSKHEAEQAALIKTLLESIFANVNGLQEQVTQLSIELSTSGFQSSQNDDTAAASTNHSDRLIFETEDPNPYYEKVLVTQLATQALMAFPSIDYHDGTICSEAKGVGHDLVTLCHWVLDTLLLDGTATFCSERESGTNNNNNKNSTRSSLLSLCSRSPSIFPALHGVLNVTAALLIRGKPDALGIKELTDRLIITATTTLTDEKDETMMHPAIYRSLLCLQGASTCCPDSRRHLQECQFLLV